MRLLLLCALFVGVVKAGQLLYEVQQPSNEEYIVCPDQYSKCPKASTCCSLHTGQWGCCPFPQASCCSDNVHCCPQGYSCNADKGQCVKAINNDTIPWAEKKPSPVSSSSEPTSPSNSLTCPDRSVCPGIASCCRTNSGTFRCCSYPNDVCCSDGSSCCPRCTICDSVSRRCIQSFATEEWKPLTESTPATISIEGTPAGEKTAALFVGDSFKQISTGSIVNRVMCNDTHYCADWQSCCLLPGEIWGCCPMRHGTCCGQSIFCCPPGKRCSYPVGRCYG